MENNLAYAGFWKRFGAYWIDAVCALPIILLSFFLINLTKNGPLILLFPALAFSVWFHIYLVYRYGGTPGKLFMKTRIANINGSAVTLKAAALRHSVLLTLSLVMSAGQIVGTIDITDEVWASLDFTHKSLEMTLRAPIWYNIANWAVNIWISSEFVVLLTNSKRRALHDFLAGTVVLYEPKMEPAAALPPKTPTVAPEA